MYSIYKSDSTRVTKYQYNAALNTNDETKVPYGYKNMQLYYHVNVTMQQYFSFNLIQRGIIDRISFSSIGISNISQIDEILKAEKESTH